VRLSKKVRAALARRRDAYVPKSAGGHQMHTPGSLNRKKGASTKTGRLR